MTFSVSRAKTIAVWFLCMAMIAMCAYCVTLPSMKAKVIGPIGVLFFGLCLISATIQLFRSGPAIVFDEIGIEDRRCSMGVIPWVEISSIKKVTIEKTSFIGICVVEPERYLNRLPMHQRALIKVAESMGAPMISLSFVGLSPSLDIAWKYIQERHLEKVSA